MRKLRCDRCGFELKDKDDLDMAFEGRDAWRSAVRSRGGQPRGVLPCRNYIRCGGEVVEVTRRQEWRRRLSGRRQLAGTGQGEKADERDLRGCRGGYRSR